MPPLTFARAVGSWTADPLGIVLTALLVVGYLLGVRAARGRGATWPWWRTTVFVMLGAGSLVVLSCGVPAAYRGTLLWLGALQAAGMSALVPLGLALGDPVGLLRETGWPVADRVDRALRSSPARFLMLPMVSSLLAVGTLLVVFLTPWYSASVRLGAVREGLYAAVLLTGSLFIVPLLGEELLPAWCTYPVRVLFGFVDGVLDAVPGSILLAFPRLLTHGVPGLTNRGWGPDPVTDQHLAGGALLAVGEGIGLPFLGVLLIGWLREDARQARAVDAELDRRERPTGEAVTAEAVAGDRPWWETDPRFAGRYAPMRRPPDEQPDQEG